MKKNLLPQSKAKKRRRGNELQRTLSPEHLESLVAGSAISPDIIDARGYRTETVKARIRELGFSASQVQIPALIIPVWGVGGEIASYQSRPDEPRNVRGKVIKYETPKGSTMVLDVHPSLRKEIDDPNKPLWITEGIKKGDALVSQGCIAVALLGVWNFRGKNAKGGLTVLADWESVALNDRLVYIVFDSDVMLNPKVQQALGRLKAFIESRGADVVLIYLPPGPGGEKVGVDDYLADGHSVADLLALSTKELRQLPNSRTTGMGANVLPVIQVSNRPMRDITDDSLNALRMRNDPDPRLFGRGDQLVILRSSNSGVAAFEMSLVELKGIMDRCADYEKIVGRDQDIKPARPPGDVVADILALRPVPFPVLEMISQCPIFLPDGSLHATNGYDSSSKVFCDLQGMTGKKPTMTVTQARALILDELLVDFPFAELGSRAHAVALLLELFVRMLIKGPRPAYLVDAPARGTGKGLLVEVLSFVCLGRPVDVMSLPPNEDEVEKRITALLISAQPMVLMDNVTTLRHNALNALLTTREWSGRLLGLSRIVRVPNDAVWVATGNNVNISDEMARRLMPIRLDAGVERPEDRTNFKHPDLSSWVKGHRPQLIDACLSLVQAWVDTGMPMGHQKLGRYEGWTAVMGGILDVAGIPGFLSNRERLYAQSDSETQDWVEFIEAWWMRFGASRVRAKYLLELAIEKHLLVDIRAGHREQSAQQRIGRALGRRIDRVFGGHTIRAGGPDPSTKNNTYLLEPVDVTRQVKTPETPLNTRIPDTAGPERDGCFVEERVHNTLAVIATDGGVPGVSGVFSESDEISRDAVVRQMTPGGGDGTTSVEVLGDDPWDGFIEGEAIDGSG